MEIKEANRKYICEIMKDMCDDFDHNDMQLRDSYSGRGMYRKNCVGIVGGNICDIMVQLMELIPELLQQSEEDGYEELYDDFIAIMKSANTDNMGRGMIVYFPPLQMITDDGDEEEIETENEGE